MFSAVVVDDEKYTLLGIINTFKWEEYGFEVVLKTTNPIDAFAYIEKYKPDVAFVDVKMPKMTGLQIIEETRKKQIGTEFIIISGHADFSYAQEAVKLGAFDYCLKPLERERADDVLRRVAFRLKTKIEDHRIYVDKDAYLIHNPQFRKLLSYINGNYTKPLKLNELVNMFYLNLSYACQLFKKTTDGTFSEYVKKLRVEKAKDLLLDPNLEIKQVSEKVGYEDYYYFNKVFKKEVGLTPYQYRKNKQEELNNG